MPSIDEHIIEHLVREGLPPEMTTDVLLHTQKLLAERHPEMTLDWLLPFAVLSTEEVCSLYLHVGMTVFFLKMQHVI